MKRSEVLASEQRVTSRFRLIASALACMAVFRSAPAGGQPPPIPLPPSDTERPSSSDVLAGILLTRRADAALLDRLASEAQVSSDARIDFYQYVKAVAQRDVLMQAKAVARVHLQDAQNLFRVGRGSNADVQAADANVAAAQLAIDQATEMVGVSEQQLRIATHVPPGEPVSIGEDVTGALDHGVYDLAALKQEAAANRPESIRYS